ncbi:hypothetical protein SISNIDRAFT_419437, partial [Sistotremastrum niveocremeum HHB9708]
STHNTRIERLWVEVGTQFARQWRAFFIQLEDTYLLDRKNPHHLWLIQAVFLRPLQNDCQAFQMNWNHKGISGVLTHGQSPVDMRFLGGIAQGVYVDHDGNDYQDIDPQLLELHLGVDQPAGADKSFGSGDSDSDSASETDSNSSAGSDTSSLEIPLNMQGNFADNFLHHPVRTPRVLNPFTPAGEAKFFQQLNNVRNAGVIPEGYGCAPGEDSQFNILGHIPFGRSRFMDIPLPQQIWEPRVVEWIQALEGYMYMKEGQ